VEGLACAVVDDMIWVGGTISAGATVDDDGTAAAASLGGQDVYVAKVSASDGSLLAVTQMGSDQDDGLVGVTVDAAGNAIVTAYTYGSWYRTRSASESSTNADWVVAKVSLDGAAQQPPPPTEDEANAPTPPPTTTVGKDDEDMAANATAAPVSSEVAPPTAAPVAAVGDAAATSMSSNAPSNAPSNVAADTPSPSSATTNSSTTAPEEDEADTIMSSVSPSLSPITTSSNAPSSLRAGGGGGSTMATPTPTTTTKTTDPVTESTDPSLNSASLSAPGSLCIVWTTVVVVLAASF